MAISQVAQLDLDNNFSRPLQVSVEDGTAPLSVQSRTKVANLNADMLDGKHASEFASSSHGGHIPPIQSADNSVYLRNDNTWQNISPSDIGAAPSSHSHTGFKGTGAPLEIQEWIDFHKNGSTQGHDGRLYINTSSGDLVYNSTFGDRKSGTIYHTGYRPTKSDIGLSNVNNWSATSSVSDSSNSKYATAGAVKSAYDRANQAFQSASDGKNKLASAITGKGVPCSSGDSFTTMSNKIGQISTGHGPDFVFHSRKSLRAIGNKISVSGFSGYYTYAVTDSNTELECKVIIDGKVDTEVTFDNDRAKPSFSCYFKNSLSIEATKIVRLDDGGKYPEEDLVPGLYIEVFECKNYSITELISKTASTTHYDHDEDQYKTAVDVAFNDTDALVFFGSSWAYDYTNGYRKKVYDRNLGYGKEVSGYGKNNPEQTFYQRGSGFILRHSAECGMNSDDPPADMYTTYYIIKVQKK